MGEVKRWECAGEDLPRECPRGPCVDYLDYAPLVRELDALKLRNAEQAAELTRLRAVEAEVTQLKHNLALSKILHHAAELKIREEHGHHMRTIEGVRNLLAEACGRKG